MNKNQVLAAALAAVVTAAVVPAAWRAAEAADATNNQSPTYSCSTHVPKGTPHNKLGSLAQVSEQQARTAAQSAAPGQVVSSTLDDDNGCLVYSVDSKSSDGKIHEVTVDAGNAKVLHQDIETKADGARETNGSESENGSESGSESESGAEAGEQGGGD